MNQPDWNLLAQVRQSIKGVLAKELAPHIEHSETTGEFCLTAHQALGRLSLAAPILSADYGGSDDVWAQLICAEEMGYLSSGFGLSSLASSCLFGANVSKHGTQAQKAKYLPQIASGEKMGCWGLTEPEIGSNAVGVKTTAQLDGDHYILNGTKTFVTNAPIADFFIVITRELDANGKAIGEGFKGGSAFILERGMAGLSTGKPFKKHGHRSSPTGEIFMEKVKVHKNQMLGSPGQAFGDMKHSLDVERIVFSGLAIGMMRFCLEKTAQYTMTRKQFDQPIANFQMVQDMIAKMAVLTDTSEKYLYDACQKLATNQEVNKQAAMAKLFIAENVMQVCNLAVQCHGGYGYTEEYFVERYLRDAKLYEIGAGTSEIQKLIIAKQTLKEIGSRS